MLFNALVWYFYPRSPCGERQSTHVSTMILALFLSTLSLRRATVLLRFQSFGFAISIHALLAESDGKLYKLAGRKLVFLSTLSLRRATCRPKHSANPKDYFYPRSPCGERRSNGVTHYSYIHFYPRSPCGERRIGPALYRIKALFLSTLSLRRATKLDSLQIQYRLISIHALLAESDVSHQHISSDFWNFYPRSPCGERRGDIYGDKEGLDISIHALLAESDRVQLSAGRQFHHFYPRSPCGERPIRSVSTIVNTGFLSTLSLRRATAPTGQRITSTVYFYPRSPCGERRAVALIVCRRSPYFYPRSPCGERLTSPKSVIYLLDISIHALLAESDLLMWYQCNMVVFLSTLSLRRATGSGNPQHQYEQISIHALLAESDPYLLL